MAHYRRAPQSTGYQISLKGETRRLRSHTSEGPDVNVIEELARAEPSGYDEQVDRRRAGEIKVRQHAQPTCRMHRIRRSRHREHVERPRHIGASRFDAGHETRPRKHLERTCEVEYLNTVEDENAGVQLLHSALLTTSRVESARIKIHARAPAAPTSYARHHAGHQPGTPAFATMWP